MYAIVLHCNVLWYQCESRSTYQRRNPLSLAHTHIFTHSDKGFLTWAIVQPNPTSSLPYLLNFCHVTVCVHFCHIPLPPSPQLTRSLLCTLVRGSEEFMRTSFIMEVSFLQFPYFRWLGSSRIKEANYLEESPSVIFRGKQNCSNNIEIQGTRGKVSKYRNKYKLFET